MVATVLVVMVVLSVVVLVVLVLSGRIADVVVLASRNKTVIVSVCTGYASRPCYCDSSLQFCVVCVVFVSLVVILVVCSCDDSLRGTGVSSWHWAVAVVDMAT